MPCEPDLITFSATGAVTPMTTAEIAGGFGQCSEPKPTTGRLNFVLNWLTCHVLGLKAAIDEAGPCTATPATTAQIAGIDLNDRVVVCADGSSAGFQLGDLPFATSAELEAIAPCTAPAITAAEQTALDADPSTGSVTVCIPDGAGKKAVAVPLDALLSGGGAGASVDLGAGVLALEFMYGPMLAFRSVFDPVSVSPQQAFNKTGWPVTSVTVPAGATHMAFMLQNTNPIGNGMQLETQGEIRLINCVPGDVFAITPTSLLQKNGANVQLVNATNQTVVLPTNKQIVSLNAKPWILEHFTTVDTANGPSGHQYACVLCPVKVA
jgi:hypothetical protein